jgi:bifunctional UDP-N-acetylglucosamine pyrophosphorylase/glucosamine-1-phosphate N-acetyltransferase
MKFVHGKNLIIKDKKSVFIDDTVVIGNNVTIYENNRIEGSTVIGDNVTIYPNCLIIDTKIGDGTVINHSQSEKAAVGKNCSVGPFARLRPNAKICDNAKIGNFVEIKNAVIGDWSKVSHLAYVGDADVGKNCNIGCGAIFVNYNGKSKNRTVIGNNCFIGSNCNIIAPVTVSSNSYICAGTTITENVNSDDFVIGRVRQQVKENRAHNYLKTMDGE